MVQSTSTLRTLATELASRMMGWTSTITLLFSYRTKLEILGAARNPNRKPGPAITGPDIRGQHIVPLLDLAYLVTDGVRTVVLPLGNPKRSRGTGSHLRTLG